MLGRLNFSEDICILNIFLHIKFDNKLLLVNLFDLGFASFLYI